MELNECFEYKFSFTQKDVNEFAIATGDKNPLHLDEEYAIKSIFKKRILHGFLGGSVFSKVFGTMWPGNGTIYLSQNMKFLKPMYTSINYTAKFEILEVLSNNNFFVSTIIVDENNNYIIEGNAIIKQIITKNNNLL